MHLKEVLSKFLRLIGADTRSAIVAYIVVALVVAAGGFSALYKNTREMAIQILTTPTPLWVTISLALLGYLYIYYKFQKAHTSSPPISEPRTKYKIKYFIVDNFKWKTTITIYDKENSSYVISGVPFCEKHELSFIPDDSYWVCPDYKKRKCDSKIYDGDLSAARVNAKSYIDKEIRNGNY